jgi:apolipoprotein N-acyltransferase
MLPRVIRSQVAALASEGNAPDVLVNVTNDSWFRGSSMLDHHLACSILCAVENRRPLLVAANTGISAEIDGSGRVVQFLERGAVGGLLARPFADARWGLVQAIGYPLGWSCAGICLIALLPGIWRKTPGQRPSTTA